MPGHSFFSTIVWLAIFGFLFTLGDEQVTASWLLASSIIPFFSNEIMYRSNLAALKRAAMRSEVFFLYLYERVAVRLRNRETGQEYWNIDLSHATETSLEETSDEPTVTQTESKQCPVCGMQNQASLHRCKRCGYDFSQEEP